MFRPTADRLRDRFRRLVWPSPTDQLAKLADDLADDLRNRHRLRELARRFEQWGFSELCLVVTHLIYRERPSDIEASLALAELYLARGRRPEAPRDQRLKDYARFFRYCAPSPRHRDDERIRRLHMAASVELTVLRGRYGSAAEPGVGEGP